MASQPTCPGSEAHRPGFDSTSPYACMMYVYLAVLPVAGYHWWRRWRIEVRFRHQVRTLAQPVSRTMFWVNTLMLASFALRALWLYLKESEVLANDETGCVNRWNCPKILVTTLNRLGSYFFFVSFSLLVSYWHRWVIAPPRNATLGPQDTEPDTGTGTSNGPSGFLTVLFFMLDVWLMIVQVVVVGLSMFAYLTCDQVNITLQNIYVIQVALTLVLISIALLYTGLKLWNKLEKQRGLYEAWLERTREAPAVGLPMTAAMFTQQPGASSAPKTQLRSHQDADLTFQVSYELANPVPLLDDVEEAGRVRTRSLDARSRSDVIGNHEESGTPLIDSSDMDDPRTAMLRLLTSAKSMVFLIVVLCVPLILIRSVLFTYRPLLDQKIDGAAERVLYPYFFYVVPEVGAGLVLLFATAPSRHRRSWSRGHGAGKRARNDSIGSFKSLSSRSDSSGGDDASDSERPPVVLPRPGAAAEQTTPLPDSDDEAEDASPTPPLRQGLGSDARGPGSVSSEATSSLQRRLPSKLTPLNLAHPTRSALTLVGPPTPGGTLQALVSPRVPSTSSHGGTGRPWDRVPPTPGATPHVHRVASGEYHVPREFSSARNTGGEGVGAGAGAGTLAVASQLPMAHAFHRSPGRLVPTTPAAPVFVSF